MSHEKNRGFTIVEMLVVLAVFSVVILVAVDVYFTSVRVQRVVGASADVQSDARFSMESMIRDIRTSRIDYAYYRNPLWDGDGSSTPIALDATVARLAIRDHENNQVFYQKDVNTDKLLVCSNPTNDTDRCEDVNAWQQISPDDILVLRVAFVIAPASDPAWVPTLSADCGNPLNYKDIGACTCDPSFPTADCLLDQTCKATDDPNVPNVCAPPSEQPIVTILFEAQDADGGETALPLQLQTTVTSRTLLR